MLEHADRPLCTFASESMFGQHGQNSMHSFNAGGLSSYFGFIGAYLGFLCIFQVDGRGAEYTEYTPYYYHTYRQYYYHTYGFFGYGFFGTWGSRSWCEEQA